MTGYIVALACGVVIGWLAFAASGQHVARWLYDQTLGRLVEKLAR